jgi:uncharacterized phage protein gp47/JayE
MAEKIPIYLEEQTESVILKRMLDRIPADIDKAEGTYIWDALAPAAGELAQAAIWVQEMLRRGFADTTFGAYLDCRGNEHGITRRSAEKAKGLVVFTGTPGKVIPVGTTVATTADDALGISSIQFATEEEVVIDSTGKGVGKIAAQEPGLKGNVVAGAINLLPVPLNGVTGVANSDPTSGGLDIEDDATFLSRYLQRVRNPSSSGNRADYIKWAMDVPRVGGVSVIPVKYGPGTVSVAIINQSKEPADQALIDTVQNHIAPPHRLTVEAETMTTGGSGVSVDTNQTDDMGESRKMVYNAGGEGTIIHDKLTSLLPQLGIWQARVRVKVDAKTGSNDLLEIGVYNKSSEAWCKTTPTGSVNSLITLKASDLDVNFTNVVIEFYWNGQDNIELSLKRLQSDAATVVWVDQVQYMSTFSKDDGDGLAPIGARVTVEPAGMVLINVSSTITPSAGYNLSSVIAAVTQNLSTYVHNLAYSTDNDVRYIRIGQVIADTTGVLDYQNLLLNSGTANVEVGPQDVAVLGTVSLS